MFAWNLIKSGAYSLHGAIDYLDTAISKTGFLEKKGNRYLWNNIKTKIRQNFLKILIATTAIGGGAGYATYQAVHQGKIISEEKDALDEGIDGNEEEKFTYLHKSKDKRYNIYRYTLGEGMGISSVIEQATQEFPSYAPDRMLLTDSVGRAYPDTTFLFPEMSVYLKLPITLLKEKPLEL
ncbi:MAG: hypothetical protein LBO09_06715 [Candidatus Peribacteria bacterium]|jgi:hypothetical protein|nr:hypothetical protein [Candidatus Peribacteria bacterium]